MKTENTGHEAKQIIIPSAGCPYQDACALADAVREGIVTGKEIIARLEHISDLIIEEREKGGVLL
jgi:hypothetical protein